MDCADADDFKMRTIGILLVALVVVIAVFARVFYPRTDIDKEREVISAKVCSLTSLPEARTELENLNFAVSIEPSSHELRAWKRYSSSKWGLRPVIFVRMSGSGSGSNCKVDLTYEPVK